MMQCLFDRQLIANIEEERPAQLLAPASILCYSSSNRYANGASVASGGSSRTGWVGAFGEMVEREHFYSLGTGGTQGKLSDFLAPGAVSAFSSCLAQTKTASAGSPVEHEFQMVNALHISSQTMVLVPSVFVSLGSGRRAELKTDRSFLPFIDSCGQAAHSHATSLFHGALLEFAERQSLIQSWYEQTCRGEVPLDRDTLGHGMPGSIRKIVEVLQQKGDLRCYEISAFQGVSVVLAVYSSSDLRETVKYSSGLSAGFDLEDALFKALLELWQSYVFMARNAGQLHRFSGSSQAYQRAFLELNLPDTASLFEFFKKPGIPAVTNETRPGDPAQLLEDLLTISDHHYFYLDSRSIGGDLHLFGKWFSPDFFIHKNITLPNNNYDNLFVRKRFAKPAVRLKSHIPFG